MADLEDISFECPDGYIPCDIPCPYCGSVEFYYQKVGNQMEARCELCGKYVKHVPRDNPAKRLAEWRKLVKARDGYECRLCGEILNTNTAKAHHLIPVWLLLAKNKEKLIYDTDNGITLCAKCHKQIHGARGTIRENEPETASNKNKK